MTVSAPEIFIVADETDEICCDGGGGALGHPRVWYSFSARDVAECGYCDRVFIRERSEKAVLGSVQSGT